MRKNTIIDHEVYGANLWLHNAFSNFFETYRKKKLSENIKRGLKRKKKVLEKSRRSYNTRNITK